ncbi:Uncharacterised protein [Mycobacteroides abscessus subsp. abscessus]|nr:Uncharacterised protein [Mycobacteroides abscessus subsp. abscessus]
MRGAQRPRAARSASADAASTSVGHRMCSNCPANDFTWAMKSSPLFFVPVIALI